MKRARNIQSCFGWAKNSEKKHHYSLPMHAPQTSDGRTHTVAGVVLKQNQNQFQFRITGACKKYFLQNMVEYFHIRLQFKTSIHSKKWHS